MRLNASIWAALNDPRPTGYIDLVQLEECLYQFWAGTLDEVPDISRIYLPVDQLIEEQPLLSQIDSDLMRSCLAWLSLAHWNAIAFQYRPEEAQHRRAIARDFVNSDAANFELYCRETYFQALVSLGELVHKKL
ncbi:hypothetical protein [Leptolyngbya sp. FACHB-16]|uniref:hypothetical protein n=1 Tax=unclassified Leptolyngbya TaxID=2650499 RepID=UPI001682B8B7|nr:hypothetical protein [Leptolyngbya sp. FACHB-16]MBD2156211.1 hypothetical protein [Leptolyngbya sp. FACHB-16]